MRSTRKRKLQGTAVRQLNVVVRQELYADLDIMRGSLSLGAAVERLIERERGRMERKARALHESSTSELQNCM
jgi:predicted CopG family antitoxin